PDTFYRLSVRTRVSGSKTNEETTCLYFRTDAGPGIPHDPRQPASLLPYSARLHTDGSVESEGNPAAQFESYVAATFPQHGALAHYFEEPLVIGFNERYLLKIFEGRPFRLRIRDRNGNYLPLPDENG